jgi:hypothetical protein
MDVNQRWRTLRLDFEPLTADHATELAPLLNDAALHEFIGGAPLDLASLTARYARLQGRRSPDGRQLWGNWLMRIRGTGAAVGTVQVTLPADGPADGRLGGRSPYSPRSPGLPACRTGRRTDAHRGVRGWRDPLGQPASLVKAPRQISTEPLPSAAM